jgi:RimJ/RimL family protein N-acetyltransferase
MQISLRSCGLDLLELAVHVVCALTLPEHNASTRILEKIGMSFAGLANDADEAPVWRWELARKVVPADALSIGKVSGASSR